LSTVRWALFVIVLLAWLPANAAKCSVSASPLSFGAYNVFSQSPLDSTASITFSCNGNAQPIIDLGNGAGTSGSSASRAMKNGNASLSYGLYLDAARTSLWGDGTRGSGRYQALDRTGSVVVYGRIFARQLMAKAGVYADTVVVTINF
jgi:spore coat protein U-like protein